MSKKSCIVSVLFFVIFVGFIASGFCGSYQFKGTNSPREFCPDCEPSGRVPNTTHWNNLGNGVDLVDATNTDKPDGSCASKIWIPKGDIRDDSGAVVAKGNVARIQIVRYNTKADPGAYNEALDRVETELVRRVKEHDGRGGETCLYVLHLPKR